MSYLPKDTQQVGGKPEFETRTPPSALWALPLLQAHTDPLSRDAFLPAPLHSRTVLPDVIRGQSAGAPLSVCC